MLLGGIGQLLPDGELGEISEERTALVGHGLGRADALRQRQKRIHDRLPHAVGGLQDHLASRGQLDRVAVGVHAPRRIGHTAARQMPRLCIFSEIIGLARRDTAKTRFTEGHKIVGLPVPRNGAQGGQKKTCRRLLVQVGTLREEEGNVILLQSGVDHARPRRRVSHDQRNVPVGDTCIVELQNVQSRRLGLVVHGGCDGQMHVPALALGGERVYRQLIIPKSLFHKGQLKRHAAMILGKHHVPVGLACVLTEACHMADGVHQTFKLRLSVVAVAASYGECHLMCLFDDGPQDGILLGGKAGKGINEYDGVLKESVSMDLLGGAQHPIGGIFPQHVGHKTAVSRGDECQIAELSAQGSTVGEPIGSRLKLCGGDGVDGQLLHSGQHLTAKGIVGGVDVIDLGHACKLPQILPHKEGAHGTAQTVTAPSAKAVGHKIAQP